MASSSPAKKARVDPTASSFKVLYPGEPGSLGHIATTRFFANSPNADLQGVAKFADIFKGIADGKALYAILPVENSASGCIAATYDLMAEYDVTIGGELGLRETYSICAKEGVGLASITRVLSHPNIIDACSSFIEGKLPAHVETVPKRTTTEAAREAALDDKGGGVSAAICTREAAKRNNLPILASNISNYTHQETRYILIHRSTGPATDLAAPFPRDAISPLRKQHGVFMVKDEPASLFKLISCFSHRNINILKVETRPLKGSVAHHGVPVGNLWDFLVFVEYAVPAGQTAEAKALLWANLGEYSAWSRDFGAYPSQTTRAITKEPQSWDEIINDIIDTSLHC